MFPGGWGFACLFALMVAGLLSPSLLFGDVPAFRDTLYFYYPLWDYLAQQPRTDSLLPQWNGLDACGVPIIAEPTSLVFYPLRIFLWLPIGTIGHRIGLFLAIHLFLAYLSSAHCARRLGLSRNAIPIAAIAYSLSGPIFFQIYNPVFLIGAAWLPMCMQQIAGIAMSDRIVSGVMWLAFAWSMMLLGGDPQGAFHAAMLGAGLCVLRLGHTCWTTRGTDRKSLLKSITPVLYIVLAGVFGILLAAVQVVPTFSWLKYTWRSTFFTGQFDFSIGMHHPLTLVFPGVFGSYAGEHTRWIAMSELRMWVPSLHIGTIGLIGLICCLKNFKRSAIHPVLMGWIGMVVFVSFVSSLGDDGFLQPIWIKWIPEYRLFRYPAKWISFTIWGLTLFAGIGIDTLLRELPLVQINRRWVIVNGLRLGCLGILFGLFGYWTIERRGAEIPIDAICGSFQRSEAFVRLMGGILHPMLVISFLLMIFRGRQTLLKVTNLNLYQMVGCLLLLELGFAAYLEIAMISPNRMQEFSNPSLQASDLGNREQIISQNVHQQFGKTHLLQKTRNWMAGMTLEPKELWELRGGTLQDLALVLQKTQGKSFDVVWDIFDREGEPIGSGNWNSLGNFSLELAEKRSGDSDTIFVRVPVFQDGGWKATTSTGTRIEVRAIGLESELTIQTPFPSSIELTYQTPGLMLGWQLSAIAWIIWIGWFACNFTPQFVRRSERSTLALQLLLLR